MNDFGINIAGHIGIVKPKHFSLPLTASQTARSFKIESGPGCSPDPGKRTVRGFWLSDKMPDTVSSYDFEYVMLDGKMTIRLPEPVDDTKPVVVEEATPGLPSKEELQAKKVRRKRG